jgi:hypothetical protein
MKKHLLILVTALLSVSTFAQIPNYVPSNGLVGWWPFNSNANDESGNGNNGTVNGAILIADRFAVANKAFGFNNLNDLISVTNCTPTFNNNAQTLSVWFKFNSQYTSSSLAILKNGTPYVNGFDLFIDQNNGAYGLNNYLVGLLLGNGASVTFISNQSELGQWANITTTYDGQSIKIYLNGILKGVSLFAGSINSPNNNLVIGQWDNLTPPNTFNRNIDDIAIWNRALTQQEITNLYQGLAAPQANITTPNASICSGQSTTLSATVANPGTPCANTGLPASLTNGLVGYWPFCGNANDASGNGNNGTVSGATLTADRFGAANNAYSFDGVNDFIQVNNNPNFSFLLNSSFTSNLWYQISNLPNSTKRLISQGDGDAQHQNRFWSSYINQNQVFNHFRGNVESNQITNNVALPVPNNWVMLTMVRDFNNNLKMYINGILVDTDADIAGIANAFTQPRPIYFATITDAYNGSLTDFFNGKLDDIGIWNRSLTQQEITQLYQLGQPAYSWSNGATTPSITVSPVQTTTYTCTISMNGASTTQSQTITVNPLPTVNAGQDQTVFAGTQVTLTGSGATSYSWNNGVSNGVPFTANTTTTYTVTGNTNGCTGTDQVLVTVLPAPTLSINTNDSICAGQTTTLTVSAAVTGTPCAGTGLPATLQNGLVGYWPFCGNANDASGNGNNGTVNGATLSTDRFGTANSAYSFDGVNDYITGVSNSLNVQASNQLCISTWINVNQFAPAPAASKLVTHTDVSYLGQQYALSIGNDGSIYFLAGNGDFENNGPNISPSGQILVNTWVHIVAVISSDSVKLFLNGIMVFGKPENDNFSGTPVNSFVFSSINNTTFNKLFNGKLDDIGIWNRALSAQEVSQLYNSGQPTYVWSNGATTPSITVSPAQTTTYTCTISMNGSTTTQSQTITVNPLPTVNAGANLSVCTGASVTLSGSGASSYAWNNNVQDGVSFIPNATTTYTVTGTDANGCTNTAQSTLTVNALPTVTATANQSICSGTSVTLSGSGALSYAWDNGVQDGVTLIPNSTTTYTVIGTAANGCTNTAQTTVTVNALPTVTAPANQTVCSGSNVTLTGGGASTYAWNNGISNGVAFPANATTTYTVTGTDANGCTNTAQTTVTVNALPTVTAPANQTVCSGTNVTLTGGGASTYAWNNGISNGVAFPANATTTYTVTGTDANGCTNTAQSTVTVNSLPTVLAASNQAICSGASVTLSGSGAVSYVWDNGVQDGVSFILNATTTFTVTGTDANGCTNTAQTTVTVNAIPTVTATANQTVCSGTNVTLNGGGASTYAWDNGVANNIPFTANNTQTYTVTGTDVNGCTNTAQITVTVNALPTVTATANQSICSGTWVTLSGSGAISYAWDNGVQDGVIFIPNATTTYTVTGTDANGCTNTAQTTVTVNALPTVNAGANQTVCAGSTATLNGSGAVSYAWNNNVQNGVPFTPNATQTYTVTGTDANGCQGTDQVLVTVASQTTSSITQAACLTYELNGQVYNQSGIFTQTLVNAQGCDSILTLNLTINGLPSIPVVNVGGDNLLSTPAVPNTTYQWVYCPSGLSISNQNDTSYLPNVNGSYAVEASNSCGTVVSECVTIDNMGIEELTNPLVIYPNPTPNVLYVQGISASETTYLLFDNQSKLLLEGNLTSIANAISLFELPSGLYHLYIGNHIFKIIKH